MVLYGEGLVPEKLQACTASATSTLEQNRGTQLKVSMVVAAAVAVVGGDGGAAAAMLRV